MDYKPYRVIGQSGCNLMDWKQDENALNIKISRNALSIPTPLQYAVRTASLYCADGTVYIPELEPETQAVAARFQPVWRVIGKRTNELQFSGYEIEDQSTEAWIIDYRRSDRAARTIDKCVSTHLWFSTDLPVGLRRMLSLLSSRNLNFPARPARKMPQTHRDTLLGVIAKRVSLDYGIHLGAAKAIYDATTNPPVRGCTIAAAALSAFGVVVNPKNADKIAQRNSKSIENNYLPFSNTVLTHHIAGLLTDTKTALIGDYLEALKPQLELAQSYFRSGRR